jgi:hypothetical protein
MTDGQSVSLSWPQALSWAQVQIFVTLRQLRVYWRGAFSLMTGRVCHLQLLLVLASSVILWSESRWTHSYILLSLVRDSPNLEDQVHISVSPRDRVTQLCPQTLGSLFAASYASVEVFEPASTRDATTVILGLVPRGDIDRIENTASKNSSIVACLSLPRKRVHRALA